MYCMNLTKIIIAVVLYTLFFFIGYNWGQTSKNIEDVTVLSVEASSSTEADQSIRNLLKESFPLITDKTINKILATRDIEAIDKDENNSGSDGVFYRFKYSIPPNYLVDTAKILWELNIPEFKSRIFQLYQKDTILIDVWNNVVGTIKDKTYTGNFEAYKIRNWPSWKDPEPGKENLPPVPPGPNNPLGLFVVHYDENSLRYFHGTNKPHLLNNKMRNLSHGCVRNENENIQKMKEFIIKKIIKSKDLSFWLESKKTMEYVLEKNERFPVKIIYKTYRIDSDEKGLYIELYKDIYGYTNSRPSDKYNDNTLIFTTSRESISSELKANAPDLSDEKIENLTGYILKKCKEYERYYIKDLIEELN